MIQRRIVFLLPTLQAGGAERVITTFMNHLSRKKFEPHFIVFDESGPIRSWIAPDTEFHSLGNVKTKFALAPLVRKLNDIKPDIVVSTMAAVNLVAILAKYCLAKKPRLIVREAVIPSSITEKQKLPFLAETAYRALYPRADLVIAPAQAILDEFRDYLGMETQNYMLLRNPVDTEKMRAQSLDVEISEGRKRTVHFIAAGRLHKQKGFDRLIESLSDFKPSAEWRLDIHGEGPEREKLQRQIERSVLEHNIKLPGLAAQPWPLYGAADAFLLPSRWEGLPNVALESLAMGTPVIAMKEAGGIGEIAALARPGAVRLAGSMEEFVHLMQLVSPDPVPQYRPSLLPEEFLLDNVMKKFESLLL